MTGDDGDVAADAFLLVLAQAPVDQEIEGLSAPELRAALGAAQKVEHDIDGWRLSFSDVVEDEFNRLPMRPDVYFIRLFGELVRKPESHVRAVTGARGPVGQWVMRGSSTQRVLFACDVQTRRLLVLRNYVRKVGLVRRLASVPASLVVLARMRRQMRHWERRVGDRKP